MKHIHSTDPRKPAIVAALKKASGGTKVTQIYERDGHFEGLCMKPGGRMGIGRRPYEVIGNFKVTL